MHIESIAFRMRSWFYDCLDVYFNFKHWSGACFLLVDAPSCGTLISALGSTVESTDGVNEGERMVSDMSTLCQSISRTVCRLLSTRRMCAISLWSVRAICTTSPLLSSRPVSVISQETAIFANVAHVHRTVYQAHLLIGCVKVPCWLAVRVPSFVGRCVHICLSFFRPCHAYI